MLLIPLMLSPVFAQNYEVLPTDQGTLNVGISTVPEKPMHQVT